ncbi:MAG: GrpB family protein [Victivallaceae bacterium]|nr:GrpB family protein [Victivallaceae bacterium]
MKERGVLYIFNGDRACNAWKKQRSRSKINGTSNSSIRDISFLVWRENYLEGPLPPLHTSNAAFEKIRAEFLHTCVPELSVERLQKFLLHLDDTVSSLTENDVAVLWFDVCMFDQVMLARILSLLHGTRAEIRLFCEDAVLGKSPEIFCRDIGTLRRLTEETIALYTEAWHAILGGPAGVHTFLAKDRAKAAPILAAAIRRYAEDHPLDARQPSRSERNLLAIIASGVDNTWPEIFHRFNAMEQHPFLGDTTCRRMLKSLAQEGKIIISGDRLHERYRLSQGNSVMKKQLSEMTLEELWQLFPILLRPYNVEYPQWYAEEKVLLENIFQTDLLRIRHIGSTSVPGLLAKPTIDILLELTDTADRESFEQPLVQAGYHTMAYGTQEQWHWDLCKGYTVDGFAERVFHLHLRRKGDWGEGYFCEYLRNHPEIARDYEKLKLGLAEQFRHDRDAYTNAKGDFIRRYTELARAESGKLPSAGTSTGKK